MVRVPTQNIHTKMKSSKQTRKLKRANLEILSKLAYLKKSNKTILWGTCNGSEVVISISKLSDSLILKLRMKEGIFSTLSCHAWLPILMSSSRNKPARAILKQHGEGVPTQNIHTKMKSSKQRYYRRLGLTDQVVSGSNHLRLDLHPSLSGERVSGLQLAGLPPCHRPRRKEFPRLTSVLRYGTHEERTVTSRANLYRSLSSSAQFS